VYRELVTITARTSCRTQRAAGGQRRRAGDARSSACQHLRREVLASNIDKADGTPLRLYTSDKVKVDVSSAASKTWSGTANIDGHEIIFLVKAR